MPVIRNGGSVMGLLGEVEINPFQKKETLYYPNPADTYLTVEEENPVWKFGQVGAPILPTLGATPVVINVPYNTVNIAIENGSEATLKVYNGSKDLEGNFPLVLLKGSIKVIEYCKNRCRTLELEGTCAEGDILISFLGIN